MRKGLFSRLLALTFAGSLALQAGGASLQTVQAQETGSGTFVQSTAVSERITAGPKVLKEITPPTGAPTPVASATELFNALAAGDYVQLTADFAITDDDVKNYYGDAGRVWYTIPNGTKYIDLNGHTIDLDGRTGTQVVAGGQTVYLYSSAAKKGKMNNTDNRVLQIDAGATVEIDNVAFEDNYQAIESTKATLTVTNCDFTNNGSKDETTGHDGGAAFVNGGTATFENSTFTGNQGKSGGALKLDIADTTSCNCDLINCSFQDNSASYGGGAIFAARDVTLTINGEDTLFKNNTAADRGGAIWAAYSDNGATITVNGGTFDSNKVVKEEYDNNGSGGVMRLEGNTLLTINDGTFKNNTTNTGGGGVIKAGHYNNNDNVRVIIHGGEFANNASMGEGGAISIGANCHGLIQAAEGKEILIHDNHMVGDKDWGGGGVFVADGGTLQIYDSAIYDNKAGGYGGGLAGCSTARVYIDQYGTAIFDNEAEVPTRADDTTGLNPEAEGDFPHMSNPENLKSEDWIYTQNDKVFHENEDYQDYFCALAGEIYDKMLGGGSEQWRGSADSHHVSTIPGTDGYKSDGKIAAVHVTGLTSYASDGDKTAAKKAAKVKIYDNGAYTHGGGVLANGVLVFGDIQNEYTLPNRFMISLTKQVTNAEEHESFLYNVYQKDGNDFNKLNIAPVWSYADHGEEYIATVGTAYAVIDLAYDDFKDLQLIEYNDTFADEYIANKMVNYPDYRDLTFYVAENQEHLSDRYKMDETVYEVKVAVWRVDKSFVFTDANGVTSVKPVYTLDIEVYEVNEGEFLKDSAGNITGFDNQQKWHPGAFWFYGDPQTPRAFFLWGRYAGAEIAAELGESYDYFWLNETENHASELALHQMKVIEGGAIRRAEDFDPSYTNRQYIWPEEKLEVSKNLVGREIGEGEFTFKITPKGYKENDTDDYDEKVAIPMPIGIGLTSEISSDVINSQTIKFTPVKHPTAVDDRAEDSTFEFAPQGGAPVPEGKTAGKPFTATEDIPFNITYTLAPEENEATYVYIMMELKDEGDVDDPALDDKQYDENEYKITVKIFRIDERNITTDILFEQIPKEFEEITNDEDGHAETWNMIYRTPGYYKYQIEELPHEHEGITFDTSKYYAVVRAFYEGEDLKTEVKYYNEYDTEVKDTPVEFTNEYKAEGEIVLHVTKELDGRDWKDTDEFTFTLAADAGNEDGTLPEVTTVTVNSENPTANFGAIKFNKTGGGTYKFTITESSGTIGGIKYDTEPKTVTVTVTDDLKGKLEAEADPKDATVTVTNVYDAAGTANLQVAKKLEEGTEWPDGGSVTFTLTGDEGAPMPSTGQNTVTLSSKGTAVFGTINYGLKDAGETYTYTISETKNFGPGWSSSKDITATVAVTDKGDGTLDVKVTYDPKEDAITNTYAAEGSITFEGKKTLEGRTMEESDVFTFTVSENDTVIAEVKNDAQGVIAYPEIKYTMADLGTHTYTVKETSTDGKGITVDTTVYTVTVTVEDNKDGTLKVTASDNATALDFVNTYEAKGDVTFEGKKTIEGREMKEDDIFTFTVTENDTVIAEVRNDAEGVIAYPTISYTQKDAGEHTYTVKETSTDKDGITVDTNEYTVTVKVEDNKDGTLTITPSDNAKALDFVNTYAAEGDGEILVEKVLNGREWTDSDKFTFTLSAAEGTPMPEVTEITITKDSFEYSDSFGLIHYTAAGTYTYTVKETKGSEKGIVYDETEHTVTIDAVDDGKGHIVAAEGTEMVQFVTVTNTYIDVKVEKVDSSNKALKGAVLAVKDSSGKVVDQWTTDGTAHEVKGLLPDQKYTLTEVSAPEGYEKAKDIAFTTGPDGLVQVVKMVDKLKPVPDTGDSNHTAAWLALMGMSALLAGCAFAFRKRFS